MVSVAVGIPLVPLLVPDGGAQPRTETNPDGPDPQLPGLARTSTDGLVRL